jgi:hypothetical protein
MKKNLTLALLTIASSAWISAAEPAPQLKPSAEFERMKALAGTWKGTTDIGQGPTEIVVQYRLLASGTTLEERIFPGTANEMLTMYYDKGGKLALTHYCMLGNRPGMLLKSSDDKSLSFEFDKTCGVDPLTETHMNALTIRFDNPETITTSCKALVNGKPMDEHPTTLKKLKS